MKTRIALSLGSILGLCVATACLPLAASASAGPRGQTAAGCAAIDTYQVSAAQSAAAVAYWTPRRMAAAESFSPANIKSISKVLRSTSGKTVPLDWTRQCAPASVGAGAVSQAPALPESQSGLAPHTTKIDGYPTVGKFFFEIKSVLKLNCTATAINDAKGNVKRELIVTAAHCIEGALDGQGYTTDDWLFAPMWHDNKFPFGKWAVQSYYINPNWMMCVVGIGCQTNPKYDYAVLVLKPQHGHGVGYYTGEDGWHINEPKTIDVRIVGIPGSSSKALVNVTRSVTVTEKGIPIVGNYLARKAATPGFTDGSSGGPWFYIFNTHTELGNLLGDTGGYEGGGPSSGSPSYSSFWDQNFANLVAMAAMHE